MASAYIKEMYIKITRSFLSTMPKEHLLRMFRSDAELSKLPKERFISELLSKISKHPKMGKLTLYLSLCEYCREGTIIGIPGASKYKPTHCTLCGKTSPKYTFHRNLERTSLLLTLSLKMRKKNEKTSKGILLEQSIVSTITSLEVLLKDVYSLAIDYKHVVFGESIYSRIYGDVRNDFLNLGKANERLKKDVGLDLKESLGKENYTYLSKMYSARHIIIHNSSVKDKDYLSQTGEAADNLNQKILITISDVKKLVALAKRVGILADAKLRDFILAHQYKQTHVAVSLTENVQVP